MKKLIVLATLLIMSCSVSEEVSALRADMDKLKKDMVAQELKHAMEIKALEEDVRVEKEKLIILSCESKFRHDGIWGDNGKSYGIAQFQLETFKELRKKAGWNWMNWKNSDHQLKLLDWAIRNGYSKRWTCSPRRVKAKVKKIVTKIDIFSMVPVFEGVPKGFSVTKEGFYVI